MRVRPTSTPRVGITSPESERVRWPRRAVSCIYFFFRFLDFGKLDPHLAFGAIDPQLKATCLHALIVRALELFKAVPPHQWFQLFWWMMLKLKEAASEFGMKGSANILTQTEPLWALQTPMQSADGKQYPPDSVPKIFIFFRPFNARKDKAVRVEDAGGLLDFREWREF